MGRDRARAGRRRRGRRDHRPHRGKLKDTAGEIVEHGGKAHIVVGDVGERADVDRMVAETVRDFGGLDVLVNNAQSSVQRRLEETTYDDVELTYRSGPLATFHAMRAALPHLRASRGSIVNLGSSAAVQGEVNFAAYAMAKEAVRGLTRVAAREWGAYGIRVNVVCPAALSPAAEAYFAAHPDKAERVLAGIPLGRHGDPQTDIGRAVAALVSDDMAYLTGATLMLEGGRTLIC